MARTFVTLLLANFLLVVPQTSTFAIAPISQGTLSLAWDPSGDPSVVGYRFYQGGESQLYTNVIDVGNNASIVISGLIPGGKYFFAVTAYDDAGVESAFSGEISYSVPGSAPAQGSPLACLSIAQSASSQTLLTGTAPAGVVYDVYASQDLSSWQIIGSVTADPAGSLQFTDQASSVIPVRYYRLRQNTPPPAAP